MNRSWWLAGLPGPVVWSEGVETFDADGDGGLDLLFANGIGFSSAGGPLAPTLLINHTTPGGPITFADESATRLPVGFVQQAKALAVCDVDGDGDIDAVFANAFLNQPTLLINDGTGRFTLQAGGTIPNGSGNTNATGFAVRVTGLPPFASGVLRYGAAKEEPPLASGAGLLPVAGTSRGLGGVYANADGVATLALHLDRLPLSKLQPGDTRFVQLQFDDPAGGGWNGSDGLEIVFCN